VLVWSVPGHVVFTVSVLAFVAFVARALLSGRAAQTVWQEDGGLR
jgi:hypothetical protein